MKISLKNCNNITEGVFDLELHKLNIKYAYNGTGKSTIARSIKAFAEGNQDEKTALTPYWSKSGVPQPWMSSLQENDEKIEHVAIFNDAYVNSYVFKFDPNSAKNNGKDEEFEVSLRTKDYESNLAEIKRMICELRKMFPYNSNIDNAVGVFKSLVSTLGATGKIFSPTKPMSPLGEECADECLDFSRYEFTEGISDLSDVEVQEKKKKEFNRRYASYLNDMRQVFQNVSKYLDPDMMEKIEHIIQTDEFFFYKNGPVYRELLSNCSAIVYSLSLIQKFQDLLNKLNRGEQENIDDIVLRIDQANMRMEDEVYNRGILNQKWVTAIKSKLKKIVTHAGKLQKKEKKQEKFVSEIVDSYNSEINAFLTSAGYNYEVSSTIKKDKIKIILRSSLGNVNIRGIKQHLSYGECNAFAMVIFLYSSIADNPDLIVFDDPISSFDGNKKFALLNLMFLSTKLLANSTVLMLTHDFTTVVDIVGLLGDKVGLNFCARFLKVEKEKCSDNEKVHNLLKEIPITQGDIKSFKTIACDHINSRNTDPLIKLVYLRRLIEFLGEKRSKMKLAYNMISSILHTKTTLDIAAGDEVCIMSAEEKAEAIMQIKGYISSFDFDREWKRSHDKKTLVNLYKSLHSNYEKIQVFRIICGPSMEGVVDDVVKKYIDETFHIENDSIFQLDPQKYDTVPLYIVDECDKHLPRIRKFTPPQKI